MTVTMQTSEPVYPVLRVDFNMLGSDKTLPALGEPWTFVLGQKVVLTDAEGNRCYGRVREIRPRYCRVRALLSTWQDGPE